MEMHVNGQFERVEQKFEEVKQEIDEVEQVQAKHKHLMIELEKKIHELQLQEGTERVIPEVSSKIKALTFVGPSPFEVIKYHFEMVANKNMWNNKDKALELVLALKGSASKDLQDVPVGSRNNNEEIIAALKRK